MPFEADVHDDRRRICGGAAFPDPRSDAPPAAFSAADAGAGRELRP